jgi:hypothetical protein
MATVLECTTEEQRSIARFLWAKELVQRIFIKKRFLFTVGSKCLSCKAVHTSVEKFPQGRWKVPDDARPGCPVEIATETTV